MDNAKRILRLSIVAVISVPFILVAVLFVMSWQSAKQILYVGCQGDHASLEVAGYPAEAVTFQSADGSVRRGWYTSGSVYPEVAIIVLPGHAGNSSAAIPDAAILAEEGFSTLIYEHRTCSESRVECQHRLS